MLLHKIGATKLLLAKSLFFEHARHKVDRAPEGCRAEAAKHFRESDPTALRRPDQYGKRSEYFKVYFSRVRDAFLIIDQDCRLLLNCQRYGLTFPKIQGGRAGRGERAGAYST